jgi:hypothetical protein
MASSSHSISELLTGIPHETTKAGSFKVFKHLANSPTCTRLEWKSIVSCTGVKFDYTSANEVLQTLTMRLG